MEKKTDTPVRETESVEYSVSGKLLDGEKVRVYRKYEIYPALNEGEIKEFNEEISKIDSRVFFINVIDIEGTIDPKTFTLKRKQSRTTNAKFKKIVPSDQK